ncbi:MAG: threonylcarbamoyl-AMP synthase [Candidatus Buchananbacteria bacterium CG10_big_fil_rev_8_21_14_0_10_42_9]|uniref:L-threonylcarbamoyladenylate synthase n=1 Tax=Candidatus Buchananbacteria bacterium CG10_big_fil_rev_8_21_14_0_10_42_9 TaxID=1974526 RepID=A0A2H0W1C7_9BACT|nr:MAG: threonylcarbamoyl-AMP synthase [Candidatus Buchananbacteria bacterium CG10_big_fil_rev_8_21_14_0_10_42_9]
MMKVVKATNKNISHAAKIIKCGGVVVFPTDTSYGLGGLFDNKKIINRVLKIKQRKDKKFTLVASSLNQVEKFFKLNSSQKKLAQKYWPGPISLVVSKQFAVRVPKNKVAQSLARRAGKPIIATSANISGRQPVFSPDQLKIQFQNKKSLPDLILDFGKLEKTKSSKIILVTKKGWESLR